jgi:hypothetical protein
MVTATVKHAALTGAAANSKVLVDGPKWDADHVVEGLESVVAGPPSAATGNIAFYSDVTGKNIGSALAFQSGNPGKAAIYSNIDSPAPGSKLRNVLQVSLGTPLPSAQQFGCDNLDIQQTIVATLTIPASDATTYQTAALAGYAITYTADRGTNTGPGAVGVFGQGLAGVAGADVFGGNFIAVNTNGDEHSIGFDMNYMAGVEIDVLVWQKPGGIDATINGGNVHGLTVAGSSNMTAVITKSSAVVVDRLSVQTDIPWDYGYQTYAGGARTALRVGPAASTGTSDSQYIDFEYLAGGAPTLGARIKCDSAANLLLAPGAGAITELQDGAGNPILYTSSSFGGGKVRIFSFTTAGVVTNDATTGQLNSVTTLPSGLTYPNPNFSGAVGTGIAMGGNSISGLNTLASAAIVNSGNISTATLNNIIFNNPVSTATVTFGSGKTIAVNNSLTIAGTDGTTLTFQGTDTYVGRATTDTLSNKTLTAPAINGLPTGTGVATANTASTLVARNGSGDFSAGTVTASLAGHASLDLALTGGTMSGGIAMGGNAIVGVSTVAGGSGTTGTQLTLQTTTGVGTTDAFAFKGGNAGATTFATLQTGSFNLQSGSTYSINGTSVLSGTALGSGVTASSLTSFGASPALTGTPTAPTAAVDTNTTQIATTAMVLGQAASATPLINGTAAVGTSTRYARADHIHPTDTTRAPLASPTFTGTVTIPNGAVLGAVASGDLTNINAGTLARARYAAVDLSAGNVNGGVANKLPNASLQSGVSTPTATTSLTGVMMGLGATCAITPAYSGRLAIVFTGAMYNSVLANITTAQMRYGTGTAPMNGATPSGTSGSQVQANAALANGSIPFTLPFNVTALSVGTAYWFDICLIVNGGTGGLQNVSCSAIEF